MTSRLQSFETEVLTQEGNFAGLAALNRELVAKAEAIASPRRVVLDMDTEVRVHGRQEQSVYNGHFESTCYHPLLLFNLLMRERAELRMILQMIGPYDQGASASTSCSSPT